MKMSKEELLWFHTPWQILARLCAHVNPLQSLDSDVI